MKTPSIKRQVMIVLSLLSTTAVIAALGLITSAAPPRVIEIVAGKDNIFKVTGSPRPVITASPGEVLKLKITSLRGKEVDSDGAVHSLTIKDLKDQGWDLRLYEGVKVFTVVAPRQPGTYIFECTVKCGDGHDDMRGKLIVK
ncbi:MAG: hypothetical protein AB1631_11400 [Acidobacteriota bacterium]